MGWDKLNAEYAAKGWPLIDPRSPDYCYQPCVNGLHVCGLHPDGDNFLTIANLAVRTPQEARALFDRVKVEIACTPGEDGDFVVDLQTDGDCEADFPMNRQMLDRLRILSATASTTQAPGNEEVAALVSQPIRADQQSSPPTPSPEA